MKKYAIPYALGTSKAQTIMVLQWCVKLKKNVAMILKNYASNNGAPEIRKNETGINATLLARDYKGFSNYDCSAILIVRKENGRNI